MEYLTSNPSETKKIGEKLAKKILHFGKPSKPGQAQYRARRMRDSAFVLGLVGELGGGKTTFLQGFAKGLGIKEKILSPSFVIMKRFDIKHKTPTPFKAFYHIDCYRIEKVKEILNLDFKEIISNPQNIVAIEWADRLWKILPKDTLVLEFEFKNRSKRKVKIRNIPLWISTLDKNS
ncbi:unnamed protein product [marine sediment metagenome]|uniref:tRNA threonylcarbamoyladenosine biosynthesis protein TsaE n=1 Tax=marine sediment metagenome TaxID=412755 RepID=X1LS78_9ZZZZ